MSGFLTNFIKGIISPSSSSKNSKSGRGGAKKSSNRQKKQQNAKNTKDDDDDENSSSSDNLSDIGNESEDNSIDKGVSSTPTDNISAVPKRGRGRPKKGNSTILAEYEKAGKKGFNYPKTCWKG
jgi:adenine specific DNA methylase Mod